MKLLGLTFTLLISLGVNAQNNGGQRVDFDNSNDEISGLYQRGSHLLYDCNNNHWVCTKKLEYKRCKNTRKAELLDYKLRLSCAYFDIYKTNKDCLSELIRLTDEGRGDRFCLHPEEKQKQRDF